MKNKYYSLQLNDEAREADISVYGDITSWPWMDSDVSAYNLSRQIEGLDVDRINLYINSYGGEVAEGLAIYNSLKRHKASIRTVCDGFACSIASVIFMAGDERIMNNASLLMIHNPWTRAAGNANEFRKQAEDLEVIGQASINAYMEKVSIDESKLKELLDNETWISPQDALDMGFASSIIADEQGEKIAQNAKKSLMNMILGHSDKPVETAEEVEEEPILEEPVESDQDEPENTEAETEEVIENKSKQKLNSFLNAIVN